MIKPKLIIIAGPNGAGKSTLSKEIVSKHGITSFDFDKEYYMQWSQFSYDPAVQRGCKEFVAEKFDSLVSKAFKTQSNFSFETNYHTEDILKYLELAEKHGFDKELIFIGLASAKLAKERVSIRVKRNGHFVPDDEIDRRYKKGLILLDNTFHRYDSVIISESYSDFKIKNCIGIQGDKGNLVKRPSFLLSLPKLKQRVRGLEENRSIGFNI